MTILLLLACAGADTDAVAVRRGGGWLNAPFPSDDRLGDGLPDLSDFPDNADHPLGRVIAGWAWRVEQASHGFANNGPIYFPLEGEIAVPEETAGDPGDPVLLVDLETGELIPLQLRFVADPDGDPYLTDHLLQILPAMGSAPRSGAPLAAVLMESAGVAPEALPDGVEAALESAGVSAPAAAATVFTVQDPTAEHRALTADIDARIDARGWPEVSLRRVVSLSYETAQTPGGETATACTATFEDGATGVGWLAGESDVPQHIDLLDWPVAVYQAEIPLYNYSGLADQPYMRAGVAHLTDTDETSGWIRFADGALLTEPDEETVRVVVQLPPDLADGAPSLIWDHGTGGTAYNIVERRRAEDLGHETAQRFADAGVAVISSDQPLFGQRYPLIDEGFTDGWLGFYNIVNLTALRDNHRQAGLEGHQLRRWAIEALGPALAERGLGGLAPDRVGRGGHSLGGATANNGVVGDPDGWAGAFISGGAGVFALSFLETGLVGTDSALIEDLAALFEVEVDDDTGIGTLIASGLGIDEPDAQARFDRMHPAVGLFQWIMDPADPAAFARDEGLPVTLLMGAGDYQVPNAGTESLTTLLPDATLVSCEVAGDYDPHYCLYRDDVGFDALTDFLESL